MSHVMIDLETLDTQPGSVILSIGAVLFNPEATEGELISYREFYTVVSKDSSIAYGMTISQDTIDWWEKQSIEAQSVLIEAETKGVALPEALDALSSFIPVGAKIWSNGTNFDQPLLGVAYARCDKALPWKYWNSRCYRTIVSLHANEKSIRPPTVLAHNALEDARWQAAHMTNVAKQLGLKL